MMNAQQLAHLVEAMIATWPAGPRARIWTATLTDLDADYDIALGVYEHLRDHDEKAPTPGRFVAVYESVTGANQPGPAQLPDYSNAISLDDHLANVTAAATHDSHAADELEQWARNRGRDRVTTALRLELGADQ